jgi:hypothetical protein
LICCQYWLSEPTKAEKTFPPPRSASAIVPRTRPISSGGDEKLAQIVLDRLECDRLLGLVRDDLAAVRQVTLRIRRRDQFHRIDAEQVAGNRPRSHVGGNALGLLRSDLDVHVRQIVVRGLDRCDAADDDAVVAHIGLAGEPVADVVESRRHLELFLECPLVPQHQDKQDQHERDDERHAT